MANYNTTVHSSLSQEAAFDYLADFTNAAEWDPNTVSSDLITGDPMAVGAKYKVVTKFAGREMELIYETIEIDRPRLVRLTSGNSTTDITDTMTFEPAGTGSAVTYDANIAPKGLAKILDPALTVIFKRVGGHAAEGLRKALKADQAK
ncbi:MAG: SRPBCC family protein [Solirubrobacterales bacterium]